MDQELSRPLPRRNMEPGVINAVGVWFYSMATHRYLYLMRNDPRHPSSWALPGGKIETGETLITAMQRECEEELGFMPAYTRLIPLEKFTSADQGFVYHTWFCAVDNEFQPQLNHEHTGWAWIASGQWPRPMHPGLWSMVQVEAIQGKIQQAEAGLV